MFEVASEPRSENVVALPEPLWFAPVTSVMDWALPPRSERAEALPDPVMARFGTFKRDMIDVARAGPPLAEALTLMDEVGWY